MQSWLACDTLLLYYVYTIYGFKKKKKYRLNACEVLVPVKYQGESLLTACSPEIFYFLVILLRVRNLEWLP